MKKICRVLRRGGELQAFSLVGIQDILDRFLFEYRRIAVPATQDIFWNLEKEPYAC
jgi:hypothetical protein